jgi:E3 ubiquitin-protein ligase listerin
MSKKFKSQASSARAASSTFGSAFFGFGSQPSPLSYVTEIPDLSTISDPTIVVALKNLAKKDSITKAKALEDLQEITASNAETGPETAVLEAWVGLLRTTCS